MHRPDQPNERRRLPKLALAALALFALFALSWAASEIDVARRRRDLARRVEEERAVLPERARALVLAMDDVVLEAASIPYPGDLAAPELASAYARAELFARSSMLFARAALPEVARLDAIGGAVRRSEKDAFALCLVKPPASGSADDVHAAATRHWLGGALFEDATHDVLPLFSVHKGLRPLSRAFAAELAESDSHLAVRRLEDEYEARTPIALALARTAASADLLVVVVDELPDGVAEPEVGKLLTATRRPAILPRIEDAPHAVRAVVWSAARRAVVLRTRARVDATARLPSREPRAPAEVHGCQAAMALRGTPPDGS